MSVLSSAAILAAGALEDVLLRRGRSIAGIIPQVVIEEDHEDETGITQHPVERGADITDHAILMPARLSMQIGWSQSGSNNPLGFLLSPAPTPEDVYKMLLELRASLQPFDVVTGKRTYRNMLIRRLSTVTNVETENCLIVDVEFQEVIIVNVGQTSAASNANLANPAQNSDTTNTGTQQGHDVTGQNSDAALAAAGVDFSVPPTDTGP